MNIERCISNKNNMYQVKWSLTVKVITIAFIIICLFINIKEIQSLIQYRIAISNAYLPVTLLFLLNSAIIFVFIHIPLSIKLNNESVILKKMCGSIRIDYSEIVSVKKINPSADLRISGSCGFCGYTILGHKLRYHIIGNSRIAACPIPSCFPY
jgi:hypothetical protein